MYISEIRAWNFRKFGSSHPVGAKLDTPDLRVVLKKGLNALIGPNDSGKTAVIDAIKFTLGIQSTEWNWLTEDDFFTDARHLRIECDLEGFDINEGKNFTEWSTFGDDGEQKLTLKLNAYMQPKGVMGDVKAGVDEGTILPAEARALLKTVYLKPLRDAQHELLSKKNSRLSQILKGHSLFKDEDTLGSKTLKGHINTANDAIGTYFDKKGAQEGYTHITNVIEDPLKAFFDDDATGLIDIGDTHVVKHILEKLSLRLESVPNPGLGSLNRLFIAAELLLFLSNSNKDGAAHIALVEELEAHLHPQAQLKVTKYLQDKCENGSTQVIITTHSPILASKINIQNLILFTGIKNNDVENSFGLTQSETSLAPTDYNFLTRFLDATKANLFFAKGVLIVEGDAENILIPAIAAKLNLDLTKHGVSIVNVGNTAFLRYVKIFQRPGKDSIPIKVSAVTDLDIPPKAYAALGTKRKTIDEYRAEELPDIQSSKLGFTQDSHIKGFVSDYWTLEYCIAMAPQLRPLLLKAILLTKEEGSHDRSVKRDEPLDKRINTKELSIDTQVQEYFEKHKKLGTTDEDIAFDLYYEQVVKPELSKAVLAQYMAQLIDNTDHIEFNDESIKYLIDSIKHATSTATEVEISEDEAE